MTQQDDRLEIAAAVTGVGSLHCTPNYRQSLKPGHAFVRFAGRGRDGGGLGYNDTWQVWVALNQDPTTAEQWLSAHVDEVIDALAPVINVNTVTPAQLAPSLSGGPAVPGVIFEGIREAG